ncbi:MAG TPA: oxygen-independent coproporphyrinogen III oxidase [Candidatus Krumholzibacteria bacterium]|nr:oxygen-independent coproporphyrinogen III oxidase [Candidatus Krumholzibacteria bacterium]
MSTRSAPSTLELLARYDRPGPRYTSYPTAVEFHPGFAATDYAERLAAADANASEPLSIYAHLPFCEERCSYCGCHVVITRHRDVAARYLGYLNREIELLAEHLPNRRRVSQMHWGGGTPTYFTPEQLEGVFRSFANVFEFTADAEISIEVDPRATSPEHIARLRRLGFNRISLGVQDFDPKVQEAVNRVQSHELTKSLVDQARAEGYSSVNIDLIYGLPFQSVDAFRRTLDEVVALRPERVAAYSFAFVPWIKGHMKHIDPASLPNASLKLELLGLTIDTFTAAGYRTIGMDHFALPEDELSRAVAARRLHRNFMGYTVQSARDMVAVGISGIGDVQGAYVQNAKKLPGYYRALDEGRLPVERGVRLTGDDLLRRYVITNLMCNLFLDVREVEERFGLSFKDTFARELAELARPDSPVADGLVRVTPEAIEVTPRGRLFVRNVCMLFDSYLAARTAENKPIFSRTV